MTMTYPIRDGRVLCGARGVWLDVEECFGCKAFKRVRRGAQASAIMCKAPPDPVDALRRADPMLFHR